MLMRHEKKMLYFLMFCHEGFCLFAVKMPEGTTSFTERLDDRDVVDNDRLLTLQNSKVQLGEEISRKLLATAINQLSASKAFHHDEKLTLDIGTIFGKLRLCSPVTTMAKTIDGTVFTDSLEKLSEQLSLPVSGHTLWHWYANHGDGTLSDGGGPAPNVHIKRLRFNASSVSGSQLCRKNWAPHLNGEIEIEVQWKSVPRLNKGKYLPEHLDIVFRSDFGKMMWNVEECIKGVEMR